MVAQFTNSGHERLFNEVIAGLESLGYSGNLLQREFFFENWFSSRTGSRPAVLSLDAAAFAQPPLIHDNACFGVEATPGSDSAVDALLHRCRSLCAPLGVEVTPNMVRLWSIRADSAAGLAPIQLRPSEVRSFFAEREQQWNPAALLRAKNIRPVHKGQLDFVDVGLMPALEEHIREKLGPLLQNTLFAALATYKAQEPGAPEKRVRQVFRLVFRALAGKVMTDRGHPGFRQFAASPDPDALLSAVNAHFGGQPGLIADAATRRVVVERLWDAFSLRHVSSAVLSLIWENTLVDDEARKTIGLYGTPPSVAKYIVERVGLDAVPDGEHYIVEPCCGSGVFLLAAMKFLAGILDPDQYPPDIRHKYLKRRLSGFDNDPFGIEVARDCLMLADYPYSNNWALVDEDVFAPPAQSPVFYDRLQLARIVLCNPPFIPDFTHEERARYKTTAAYKPAEILDRVLSSTPNLRGIGFVMPHRIVSGIHYRRVRSMLAERFESIETVSLPESGVFSKVHYETVALIARSQRADGDKVFLASGGISDSDWPLFNSGRFLPSLVKAETRIPDTTASIGVYELQEVWLALKGCDTVNDVTGGRIDRGVQWNKSLVSERDALISDHERPGFRRGLVSKPGELFPYIPPPAKYLSFKPEDRKYDAFDLPWDLPKVIMNSNRKGWGHPWQIAAFPDRTGLTCADTYKALWPLGEWTPELLAAVLNGPVANAYVYTHATGRQLTDAVLKPIPVPRFDRETKSAIEAAVKRFMRGVQARGQTKSLPESDAKSVLLTIDALVLGAYQLPPPLERKLVNLFRGENRPLPFRFPEYVEELLRRRLVEQTRVLEQDTDEQRKTWEALKKSLDKDRHSFRKLFP